MSVGGLKETYGDYDYIPANMPGEGDVLLVVTPVDLMTFWGRCGLIADFIGSFYSYVDKSFGDHGNFMSTIMNELIENAAKFSLRQSGYVSVEVRAKLFNEVLMVSMSNTADETKVGPFRGVLTRIFNSGMTMEDLYFQQIGAKDIEDNASGIGLIMIMKDYPVKVGVGIERVKDGMFKIETQVYCFIGKVNE